VVDDGRSNGWRDGELELLEAVLKFRGFQNEDSEGKAVVIVGIMVSA